MSKKLLSLLLVVVMLLSTMPTVFATETTDEPIALEKVEGAEKDAILEGFINDIAANSTEELDVTLDAPLKDYSYTKREVEPNNTLATADAVGHDYIASGKLTARDVDIFKFTASSRSTVEILGLAACRYFCYGLYTSSNTILTAAADLGKYNSSYYADLLQYTVNAGTYYIVCLDLEDYYNYTYTLGIEIVRTSTGHTHSYTATVTPPTCTAGGYTTYTCSCGNSYTDDETAALGHDHVETVTPATCTTGGYSTFTCSRCGDTYTGNETPAGNHSFTTSNEIPATCTQNGSRQTTCAHCGAVGATEVIYATGHVFDSYEDKTCNICGHTRVDQPREVTHMYRMYNPNTGEHFYTGSDVEKNNLIGYGWQYEGVGFSFPRTTGKPIYRLFEPATGEHLYTMDEAEKANLMASGWNYEGIAFNSGYDDEVPQFRLHNPNATVGAYHFTASPEERDNLMSQGWEYQGIGWYSCWN